MTYPVIYADPPWQFGVRSKKGLGRSAEAHYDTMPTPDICALASQVQALASPESCALCIWVTDPMLDQALEVIKAWGFTYKTVLFTWVKLTKPLMEKMTEVELRREYRRTGVVPPSAAFKMNGHNFAMGCGYYTRANPEMCLLATRGKRAPKVLHRDVRQLLVAPRGQHSAKPVEARQRIERLFSGPYVELFSRAAAPGWDTAISNQAGLLDSGTVETRRWASNSYPNAESEI